MLLRRIIFEAQMQDNEPTQWIWNVTEYSLEVPRRLDTPESQVNVELYICGSQKHWDREIIQSRIKGGQGKGQHLGILSLRGRCKKRKLPAD